MDFNVALLSIGAIVVVLGAASWKSGGRGAVLAGVMIIGLVVFLNGWALGENARYAALALPSAVLILALFRLRTSWRSRRPELLLAGGALLAILGSQLLDPNGNWLGRWLAVIAALFGIAFIATASIRLKRMIDEGTPHATGKQPRH